MSAKEKADKTKEETKEKKGEKGKGKKDDDDDLSEEDQALQVPHHLFTRPVNGLRHSQASVF